MVIIMLMKSFNCTEYLLGIGDSFCYLGNLINNWGWSWGKYNYQNKGGEEDVQGV